MLDRGDARSQRRLDPVGAVRVGRDLAPHPVRRLDDGLQLVLEELLVDAGRGHAQHAAGRRDLDQVDALPDARADGLAHLRGTVGGRRLGPLGGAQHRGQRVRPVPVPAGDADRGSGDEHPRAGDHARLDAVAKSEAGRPARADVADGREAGQKRALGVDDAVDRRVRLGLAHLAADPLGDRDRLPRQVRVAVDEPREDEVVTQIDELRAFDAGVVGSHALDHPVPDDERGVRDRILAGHREQLSAQHDHDLVRPRGAALRGPRPTLDHRLQRGRAARLRTVDVGSGGTGGEEESDEQGRQLHGRDREGRGERAGPRILAKAPLRTRLAVRQRSPNDEAASRTRARPPRDPSDVAAC